MAGPCSFELDQEIRDLGHRFEVDPETARTFGRNASTVPDHPSRRLELRGRGRRIRAREEFAELPERVEACS